MSDGAKAPPVDGIARDGVLAQRPGVMVFPTDELRRALAVGGVHPDWIATIVDMIEYAQKHRDMEEQAFVRNRPTPDEMERVANFLRTCAAGERMEYGVPLGDSIRSSAPTAKRPEGP